MNEPEGKKTTICRYLVHSIWESSEALVTKYYTKLKRLSRDKPKATFPAHQ
jgi:hypothetical protein